MKCNDSNAHLLCDTKLGNISAHLPDFVPMSNMLRAQSAIFHFLVTFLFKFHFYFLFYICIFCICMLFYRRSEFTLIPLQVSVVHACSMQRRWPVSLQPPLHPQPVTNIPTKDSKLKVDFQVKGTMKVGRKKGEKKMEKTSQRLQSTRTVTGTELAVEPVAQQRMPTGFSLHLFIYLQSNHLSSTSHD